MLKMFFLKKFPGLSEFEFEKQCINRIFFRKSFGFPEYLHISIPVWSFREIIIDNCKEK